ncbi:MAG TPA: hypothetical protein DCE81_05410, partial [Cytophagales bacterium]|nr:hypothetical protein [Cytophagales bacterium]
MKRIALFALLLFALLAAAEAQPKRARGRAGSIREADQKTVDAAQVPEAVRQAQNVAFPGLSVTRWEQRSGKNNQQNFTHYVA